MNTTSEETSAREEYESNENDMDEDDEDIEDMADDANRDNSTNAEARHKSAMTGRGVTLSMLMADEVIFPGEDCMSIEYLGQKFSGDLLSDSRIRGREEERIFMSPSAWASHCKRIVNPSKKSGCGWASVKYKGKKLKYYKSIWVRKHRQLESHVTNGDEQDSDSDEGEDDTDNVSRKSDTNENDTTDSRNHSQHNYLHGHQQHNQTNQTLSQQPQKRTGQRNSVSHKILGVINFDHDQTTLVQVTNFVTLGKIQPFNVSISTNCLLLMDFHSHLVTSEIIGYLAGKWDTNTQELTITQTFPLRCRHSENHLAPKLEEEIRNNMERRGLTLVGWYHSHPESQPDPSLRDIEAQMQYQHVLRGAGNTYHPCLGMIISPYDPHNLGDQKEAQIQAYWVMPPPEHRPLEYGMPMNMVFTVSHDRYFSQDILNEMKALVDYYKSEPDYINFTNKWFGTITYFQKLEGSMARKFPKDETDGRVLEYLRQLLVSTSAGR